MKDGFSWTGAAIAGGGSRPGQPSWRCVPRVLALLTAIGFSPLAVAAEAPRALAVTRATDVVRQWQPAQHLYVKGNLGVNESTLDALEGWLDQTATNWVVVLAENAEGETYTDAEGQTYRGIEAVNHALGKGLMNQTAFGQQLDPRTRERNAAFFVLFLKERRLTYYGSDAQDRRRLGEDDWEGNLDKPAVSAMRNGARVVDAVKDTISNIDRRLSEHIIAEVENAKRRVAAEAEEAKRRATAEAQARAQALEQAKAALENARTDYFLVESESGEFGRRFTGLTGDLSRPDLPGLKAELAGVQTAVTQNDTTQARRLAEALHARTQTLLRGLKQYPEDGKKLNELAAQLATERSRPLARSATGALQAAQEALDGARREHERGDSAYVALLEGATRAFAVAHTAISNAEAMAERQRMLLGMVLFSTLAGALALGVILNRRRLPAKNEAQQLRELWEKGLSEKTSALFGLLDRRSSLIGTSADEAAQRYSGGTLQLSQQIIQDVDELFIMSSCAGRVLELAGNMISPAVVWPRAANLLFAGSYRQAIALLRDHPIAFKPEDGLELVVRGTRTERDRLIGGLASYQAFTMTFNELIEAFNQRAQRALSSLDSLEASLSKAPEIFKTVRQSIEDTQKEEAALASATQQDGYFDLRRVFEELLPSAQKALSSAYQTAITNPVDALQAEGARAEQQAADAAGLVTAVQNARTNGLPKMREAAATLEKSGIDASWMGAALRQLSLQADHAAKRALASSARAELDALEGGLAEVAERALQAAALDTVRREEALPQIARSNAAIKQAREEIGAGLGKAAGETLREEGCDPTDFVAQAQAQLEGGFAALSRGDVAAARNAFEAVASLTNQAGGIVDDSLAAFRHHRQKLESLQAEAQRVATLVPDHARILADISSRFAAGVLRLGAGDAAHPNANGTLADNIQETEAHLATTRVTLDKAAAAFEQAKVLEASERLEEAKGLLQIACHRLAEIEEKQKRLAETDSANRQLLQGLDQRRQECERSANEPTTMTPTVEAYGQAAQLFEAARTAALAEIRDPFQVAATLSQVKLAFDAVADRARCDRDVYEQAGRSLAAAATQLTNAQGTANQTATDNLPDSSAIRQACGVVGSLHRELQILVQQYRGAHGDWHSVDREANSIGNRAAAATATLKGEMERAQACIAALSTASNAVRNAGAWTGGFGVMILGAPGSDLLGQARAHLERGEYQLALRLAENARSVAERAIAQAQAEEHRRRQEAEAEAERARQRRRAEEARRWQSSSSHSSSSGGSSSWSRSGSGTRSSSFSSGSGTRTSSW